MRVTLTSVFTVLIRCYCIITISSHFFVRPPICEKPAGRGETAGAHGGCSEEAVRPEAPPGATVLRSPPGPPNRAEDTQPLPRRDAHILESERPQVHAASLRDLGRAVTSWSGDEG